ncbi:MAG: DUF2505 family protein [Polyangiales bacterium]
MDLEIRHVMECDIDTYWRCVFDDEYNRRLYADALKFREMKVLQQDPPGDQRSRKLQLNPPAADLPAPIAKVIGDLSWREEGTFDAKSKRYRFKIIPASMPDKTTITGEVYCESKGEKRCERVLKMNVEVKIFMVGGLVEKRIADDTRKSYETAARFTNEYVKEKGW